MRYELTGDSPTSFEWCSNLAEKILQDFGNPDDGSCWAEWVLGERMLQVLQHSRQIELVFDEFQESILLTLGDRFTECGSVFGATTHEVASNLIAGLADASGLTESERIGEGEDENWENLPRDDIRELELAELRISPLFMTENIASLPMRLATERLLFLHHYNVDEDFRQNAGHASATYEDYKSAVDTLAAAGEKPTRDLIRDQLLVAGVTCSNTRLSRFRAKLRKGE